MVQIPQLIYLSAAEYHQDNDLKLLHRAMHVSISLYDWKTGQKFMDEVMSNKENFKLKSNGVQKLL